MNTKSKYDKRMKQNLTSSSVSLCMCVRETGGENVSYMNIQEYLLIQKKQIDCQKPFVRIVARHVISELLRESTIATVR